MEIQELQKRIADNGIKLEKIAKRIAKHSRGLSNEDKQMAELPYSQSNNKTFSDYCKTKNPESRDWVGNFITPEGGNLGELRSAISDEKKR